MEMNDEPLIDMGLGMTKAMDIIFQVLSSLIHTDLNRRRKSEVVVRR